jgi:hypothetical protein
LGEQEAATFVDLISPLGAKRRLKHIRNIRNYVKWATKLYATTWTVEMFPLPTKRELRGDGRKFEPYTPAQFRRLLQYASDRLRLVIMLGINLAMGPDEMTHLTREMFRRPDFTEPRRKNKIPRQIPVWPELRAMIPPGNGLLFPGQDGKPLEPKLLIKQFGALCKRACVPRHGLYNFRRTFRTIADDWGDQRAAAKVMGRELPDTDTVYVLNIKRDRLERMMDHVKTSLRVDRALRARRYDAWVFGLSKRIHWRTEGGRATPTRRRTSSDTAPQLSDRAPAPAASASEARPHS